MILPAATRHACGCSNPMQRKIVIACVDRQCFAALTIDNKACLALLDCMRERKAFICEHSVKSRMVNGEW
ncbi:MAG: hypothetical protein ACI8PP_002154 [Candidatus Pseudothioglobus sp.]|jgi:hypothetical protein